MSTANSEGLRELKKSIRGIPHFGLNVVKLDENENSIVFRFSADIEEQFEHDVALTILGKKRVTLTGYALLDHPLFASALKDPSVRYKVFAMRIGDLVSNKLDTYVVYTKEHKDDAILQALIHSFETEIDKKMEALYDQALETVPKEHRESISEGKIRTYITGHLFGYPDIDIMAYVNNWGIGKKTGVEYFRKDIQKKKEEIKAIKRIALRVIKHIKASDFFAFYKKKATEIEMPLYKLITANRKSNSKVSK